MEPPRSRPRTIQAGSPDLPAVAWLALGFAAAVSLAAVVAPPRLPPPAPPGEVALPAPSAADLGDSRRGAAATTDAPHCRDGELRFDCIAWSTPLDAASLASFATGTYVFAAPRDGTVQAFSFATGERQWTADLGSDGLGLLPPQADGVPVVHEDGPDAGDLTVIQVADGDERWRARRVAAGRDFVTSINPWLMTLDRGVIRALSIGNGRAGWQHELSRGEYGRITPAGAMIIDAAAGQVAILHTNVADERWRVTLEPPLFLVGVDGFAVYVSAGDGRLHAIQTSTGRELWASPAFDDGATIATARNLGHLVVVTSFGPDDTSSVVALDFFTGELRWRHDIAGIARFPTTIAAGTVLLRTDLPEAGVRAYAADTGRLLWQLELALTPYQLELSGPMVVIADRRGLTGLDLRTRDAHVRWRMALDDPRIVHEQPLVVAGSDLLLGLDAQVLTPHRFAGD